MDTALLALGFRDMIKKENQMEKKLEHEMETENILGLV